MSCGWNKAKEQSVKLPEDVVDVFHLYSDILYTDHIAVTADAPAED